MPWGLRVRDATGSIEIDTSTYTSRWLGVIVTTGAQAGFVDVPLAGAQKPMFAILNVSDRFPDILISGARITYQTYGPCRIFYGVR